MHPGPTGNGRRKRCKRSQTIKYCLMPFLQKLIIIQFSTPRIKQKLVRLMPPCTLIDNSNISIAGRASGLSLCLQICRTHTIVTSVLTRTRLLIAVKTKKEQIRPPPATNQLLNVFFMKNRTILSFLKQFRALTFLISGNISFRHIGFQLYATNESRILQKQNKRYSPIKHKLVTIKQ